MLRISRKLFHASTCRGLCVLLCAFASGSPAADVPEAPFGLRWGTQPEVLRKQVPELERDQRRGDLRSYMALTLPENLAGAARYHLLFDRQEGLVKVQYLSELITGDDTGMKGRDHYRALKLALGEKYGMPEVEEMYGLVDAEQRPTFYACLKMPTCGWWHSTYRHDGMKIRLRLHGAADDAGFVSLEYESPRFGTALGRYERAREEAHEAAL